MVYKRLEIFCDKNQSLLVIFMVLQLHLTVNLFLNNTVKCFRYKAVKKLQISLKLYEVII